MEIGSERGAQVLSEVSHAPAAEPDRRAAAEVHARTASQMGRELDTDGIKELLYRNYDHLRWEEVAERCLTCGNCTMVCPTCFCTTVEDLTNASLAASTGVETSADVARYLLAGADVVMSASALLRHGQAHATVLLDGLTA